MAAGVQLLGLHVLWWLERKGWTPKLPGWVNYFAPDILSFLLISMREPMDVAHGQLLVKVFTDWISWAAGFSVAAWALYRLEPRLREINQKIKRGRT
jgi:hypothetical protein